MTTNWTAGYVADVEYTYGYYSELNPLRLQLAFLSKGLAFPEVGHACELGFGQGVSTNIHAAASTVSWHGTDFSPSQAAFARHLADVSGSDAQLFDQSFEEFAQRDDLPEFDFIAMHGIWSWISDSNRQVIVDFIRRKLKVGGVLYVSYNTQPGWSSFAPIRHLMTQHSDRIGAVGRGYEARVDEAIQFASKLLETNPAFLRANPLVAERLAGLNTQSKKYLAHEYFNKDWHPMHFSTVADWFGDAKLSFACSAHYLDHIDQINFTAEQQAFLSDIADDSVRESVRDFMVNQQFRRDYWVKGPLRLNPLELAERFRAMRVVLSTPRSLVTLKAKGVLGEAEMADAVYTPILDYLADNKPRTVAEIEKAVSGQNINLTQLWQALLILGGNYNVIAAQPNDTIAAVRPKTAALNERIIQMARGSNDVTVLASPVTGSAVSVNRFAKLFILATTHGLQSAEEWAQYAWSVLDAQNQKLVHEGTSLMTAEENLAELQRQAKHFQETSMPVLKALQVI